MTDLPPMVPSAYQRASAVADEPPSEFDLFWKLEGALDAAYRDGRQSRQPEIDALRAALAEAERAHQPAKDLRARWDKARQFVQDLHYHWLARELDKIMTDHERIQANHKRLFGDNA